MITVARDGGEFGEASILQIVAEAKDLTEQEKLALIAEIDHDINEIESAFSNPKSLIAKVWGTDKKEIINFWGERLEMKYRLTGQNDKIRSIANQINKRLQSFRGITEGHNYAYEVLPAKYKSHDANPSDDSEIGTGNSSLNTEEQKNYAEENKFIIALYAEAQNTLDLAIKKAKEAPVMRILLKTFGREKLEDDFRVIRALNKMAADAFDDRQTVPVPIQHLLLKCAYETSVADAYSKYLLDVKPEILASVNRIKKRSEFTAKMTRKIITGAVPELDAMLEPRNRTQARIDGFSGHQCPECDSWCTNLKPGGEGEENWYKCQKCKHEFKSRFVPLYRNPNAVELSGSQITHTNTQY